jgi:hypothetical protein
MHDDRTEYDGKNYADKEQQLFIHSKVLADWRSPVVGLLCFG